MIVAPAFRNATSEIQIASAALGLFSVAELVIASRVRTRADTRYWRNLPDTVHVLTCAYAPGEHNIVASFCDDSGTELTTLRRQAKITFTSDGHGVAWVRSRSALTCGQ